MSLAVSSFEVMFVNLTSIRLKLWTRQVDFMFPKFVGCMIRFDHPRDLCIMRDRNSGVKIKSPASGEPP